MYTVIEKLHTEHIRLECLVRLLNGQSCLRTDATAPNIALLVDALCYLTRFPDVTHHVIEDRIVEKLLARKALSIEFGHEIEVQHAALIRDGRDLLRDLESATRGGNMSQELVDVRVRLYAERLRHNMAVEELTLFPAAEKYLSGADWSAIERHGELGRPDPLFDAEVDERFAELYRVITAEAKAASVEGISLSDVPYTVLPIIAPLHAARLSEDPVMPKKVLGAEQIRQEVHKRILRDYPAFGNQVGVSLPLPKAHLADDMARNWDMEKQGHAGYGSYIRRVVDEARKEFFLSDAADHNEVLGDSLAHD